MWELTQTREKCRMIRSQWIGDRHLSKSRLLEAARKLPSRGVLLEIGCGRSARLLHQLAADFEMCYGIDPDIPDKTLDGNIMLLPGDGADVPLENQSVDVIISVDVFEHLEYPLCVMHECKRLLRPGGHMLILAPNVHYPPLVLARALPHRLRRLFNKLLTGTNDHDTFPAFYRANSIGDMSRLSRAAKLNILQLEYVTNHPEYLMFSTLVYRAGILLERFIMHPHLLGFLRHSVMCHLQKPSARQAIIKPERVAAKPALSASA